MKIKVYVLFIFKLNKTITETLNMCCASIEYKNIIFNNLKKNNN